MDTSTAIAKAKLSLAGLSVGDAFGELFFTPQAISRPHLPPGPWPWTDDTHMALSIVEILQTFGRIEQDALAQAFARRFMEEPYRGYARGAMICSLMFFIFSLFPIVLYSTKENALFSRRTKIG